MVYLKIIAIIACVIVIGFVVYLGCSNIITEDSRQHADTSEIFTCQEKI